MPGIRFAITDQQQRALEADQWAQQQREKLADDWATQTQASLQPTPSDSLTNPLGTGNRSVDQTVSAPFADAGQQLQDVTNQVSASPTLPRPDAPVTAPLVAPQSQSVAPPPPAAAPPPDTQPLTPSSPVTAPLVAPSNDYEAQARAAAVRHGLDPDIFVRQLQQESGLNPYNADGSVKTSPAGARGIAQFMPDTARGLGINPDDPAQAIEGAATLMQQNLQRYGGDYGKALAAYNAGPGNVDKYGGIPPFEETKTYVSNILGGAGQAVSSAVQGIGQKVQDAASTVTGGAIPASSSATQPADLSLSQFGDKTLTAEEAYAACGPAAAARLATIYGDNIPLSAALAAAKQVGWTPQGGMNGIANEKKLMDALGLPAELDTSGDWNKIIADATSGKVVTISTPGHYFTANGTRPRADGQTELYVGQSGLDLKGGKAWMTPSEIEGLMGQVNGALTSDPGKAAQAGDWMQKASVIAGQPTETTDDALKSLQNAQQKAGLSSASPSPSNPLDAISRPFGDAFQALGDVAGQVKDAAGQAISGAGNAIQSADQQYGPNALLTKGEQAVGQGVSAVFSGGLKDTVANELDRGALGPMIPAPVQSAAAGFLRSPGALDSLQVVDDLRKKYGTMDSSQYSPEDRQAYSNAVVAVGGMADMAGPGQEAPTSGRLSPEEALTTHQALGDTWTQLDNQAADLEARAAQAFNPGLKAQLSNQAARVRAQQDEVMSKADYLLQHGTMPPEASAPLPQEPLSSPASASPSVAAPVAPPRPSTLSTPSSVLNSPTLQRLKAMRGTPEQQAAVGTPEEGRAANILLAKFPEDVRPSMQNLADQFGQFAGQRRGVITDDQAMSNAVVTALGTTPEQWIRTPAGKAFNQEQAIALGQTLSRTGQEYDALLKTTQTARTAGQVTPQMEADLADKALQFAALSGVRSGAAAEAGRTLRSFRAALSGTSYGVGNRDKAIDAAFKAIGTDRTKFSQWVEAYSQIPESDQIAKYKMLQGLTKPTWLDRLSILRYASMLSATTTHLVNAFGNTINVGLDIATKPIAVGIDVARAARTGGERTRYMGELGPQVQGLLTGAISGASDAWTTLKTGVSPSDLGKFESVRPGFQSGNAAVDAVVEMPLRALGASDNIFRGAARGAEVGALAARQGIQEGLTGQALRNRIAYITQNLPEFPQIAIEADKRAASAVLQEPNKMASAFTSIGRGPGVANGAQRIVREMVIPFAKTPANILAQGLNMTPIGAMKVIDKINAKETGAATDAAARVLFGSTVATAAGALAANGLVTGGYPADPKERETLPPGWQPWSLRLPDGNGGSNYYEFSRLGPVAIPFAVGAVIGQSLREGQVADPVTLASSLGKFMLDQTFLQGLSDVTDAIKDPKRSGEKFSETLATSYVPYASLSRQITRALDMADRDPHGALEAIMAINPATANQVPRRQDALGREIHSTQTGAGAFISPIRYSQSQPEPVLNAFRDVGMGIPPAPSEIRVRSTVTGNTSPPIALNEVEQKQYQRVFGERLNQRVSALIASGSWTQRSPDAQKRALDQQVQAARDYAEGQIFRQIPQDERTRRMQEGRLRQQVKPLPAA